MTRKQKQNLSDGGGFFKNLKNKVMLDKKPKYSIKNINRYGGPLQAGLKRKDAPSSPKGPLAQGLKRGETIKPFPIIQEPVNKEPSNRVVATPIAKETPLKKNTPVAQLDLRPQSTQENVLSSKPPRNVNTNQAVATSPKSLSPKNATPQKNIAILSPHHVSSKKAVGYSLTKATPHVVKSTPRAKVKRALNVKLSSQPLLIRQRAFSIFNCVVHILKNMAINETLSIRVDNIDESIATNDHVSIKRLSLNSFFVSLSYDDHPAETQALELAYVNQNLQKSIVSMLTNPRTHIKVVYIKENEVKPFIMFSFTIEDNNTVTMSNAWPTRLDKHWSKIALSMYKLRTLISFHEKEIQSCEWLASIKTTSALN